MAEARTEITLKCTVCGEENYITTKNKKAHPERFEINKFCPRCGKKTVHKEKR
ncbi:MAG: 50S ribosomal protein L33 [Firmicutes bacterium]|uniref:Large ribosomal subunit protein bL33 n=1 Tax=Candidatus Scatoplasma merdavium TaxID=2840932 RepID=A0A9D9D9D5_9BACL|nr:50S ribosomal protein L33 [Candidatus Scatoplasma merdavium]